MKTQALITHLLALITLNVPKKIQILCNKFMIHWSSSQFQHDYNKGGIPIIIFVTPSQTNNGVYPIITFQKTHNDPTFNTTHVGVGKGEAGDNI
jgi:hypothetical protein